MDLPAPSNVTLLDLVPPSCAEACGLTSSSFQTCDYGTCICTEDNANGLEGCISCLYASSPTQDIYDAGQSIFADFEDTCSPALNFSLRIIPDYNPSSSSGGTQATDPVTPTIPFTSQTTRVTVPSQTAQWTVNNKQVCRAVHRQSSRRTKSSGYSKKIHSASTIVVVVAILLSTLIIHFH